MKLEIVLQIKNMRMLKGVLYTLQKILFEQKNKVTILLVYFTQHKQLRLLIQSDNCMAILALDPKIFTHDNTNIKQNTQILAIQLMDAEDFIKNIIGLLNKEGSGDIILTLSKDKAEGNQEAFRSLNFINPPNKTRSPIYKPLYDPPKILNHVWLNGCHADELKKVEFDFDSEHLLSLLRVVFRSKEVQAKEKMIYVYFNFREGRVEGSLERLKHNCTGEISEPEFKLASYKGNYLFSILPDNAGKLYELFTAKSSGRRFIINLNNSLVYHYYHPGVFESQLLISEWIRFQKFEGLQQRQRAMETKLQS